MTADSRRPDALRAAARQTAAPAIDSAGNPAGGRTARNPLPRLRFPTCAACGEPVTRKGYARTDIAAARERGRYRRRHRDQDPPPLVPWRFMHAACDPDAADPSAYLIGVGAARTMRALLVAVLKLTSREWADETDWRRMVAAILTENRPPPE